MADVGDSTEDFFNRSGGDAALEEGREACLGAFDRDR